MDVRPGERASPDRGTHWDTVYRGRDDRTLSWFEHDPATSFSWVTRAAPDRAAAIVDVGSGTSRLVDRLLDAGYRNLTVLDASAAALAETRSRLGVRAGEVRFVAADLLAWTPDQPYDVWHDRAVFHFLVTDADRARYLAVVHAALRPGGRAVIATFAPTGPTRCSGLPTARYGAASLAGVVGAGFELRHHAEVDHVTPDGRIQPFTWADFECTEP